MPSPGHFEIPRARHHDRSRSRRFVVPCGIAALTVALASACGGARAANAGGVGVLADSIYDVVITNGRIVDGTGNAWFYGEIAIRGDRIARIERRGSQRFLWNKNAVTGGTR